MRRSLFLEKTLENSEDFFLKLFFIKTSNMNPSKPRIFKFYKTQSKLISCKPECVDLHRGYLKDDAFCLKVTRFSPLALFLCDLGNIQNNYSCIYVKRIGQIYEFIAVYVEHSEDERIRNEIQPEEMKNYRLWSVDYLSIFFKWVEENKLVSSL
jgi:hypothetical protein